MGENKNHSTISIRKEVLSELKELKVNFHGITPTNHNDKILYLMKLYKENNK